MKQFIINNSNLLLIILGKFCGKSRKFLYLGILSSYNSLFFMKITLHVYSLSLRPCEPERNSDVI